jgi:hypothetical protein
MTNLSPIGIVFERRITRFRDHAARVLLGKLIKATLVTLAVVLSLTSVGVDLTTFALFTGALGVGIGLGLQRTVSNLVQRHRAAARRPTKFQPACRISAELQITRSQASNSMLRAGPTTP